jgi:hypothetical protein
MISSPGLSNFVGYPIRLRLPTGPGGLLREKAPREPWPKPQPSRGSRPVRCRAGDPTPIGSFVVAEASTCAHWSAPIRRSMRSGDRSPRFQGGAGPKARRPIDRPTIPEDPRSARRPNPEPTVSRWLRAPAPGNSSRPGFRRSVPTVRVAAGSPLWRDGQRRQLPGPWQTRSAIGFRDLRMVFAGRFPPCHRSGTSGPGSEHEKTPRELRPKPQPSRGSRTTLPGKRAPSGW